MSDAASQGRRRRVIAFTASLNILGKGLYFALNLLAFRWTLPYLGAERFGIFATILGFSSLLSILDLGVGNVLVGSIARLKADGDLRELGAEASAGLGLLGVIGILALVLLAGAAHVFPTSLFFKNLAPADLRETAAAVLVFATGYCLTMPVQGLQRIAQGLQIAYVTHAASVLFTLVATGLLFLATRRHAEIPELVAITYILPALAPLCVIPKMSAYLRAASLVEGWSWLRMRRLLQQGGIFFLLQLGVLAGWGGDSLLASSQLGLASAGIYAVAQRMFQLVNYPLAIMNAPLWPAYADAHARNDGAFIRHALKRSLLVTGCAAAFVSLIVASFPGPIMQAWLHARVDIPTAFLYALAFWTMTDALGNSFAMFMNGVNLMRPQLYTNLAYIALALAFKWFTLPRLGLLALPLSTIAAYFLAIVIPYAIVIKPHREWFGVDAVDRLRGV